jgi:hypothetical protein
VVIMSKAFVFLNCDFGAESATIEEMRDITCILKPGHCRACEMDLGNHVLVRKSNMLFEGSLMHILAVVINIFPQRNIVFVSRVGPYVVPVF